MAFATISLILLSLNISLKVFTLDGFMCCSEDSHNSQVKK